MINISNIGPFIGLKWQALLYGFEKSSAARGLTGLPCSGVPDESVHMKSSNHIADL